MPAIRVRDLRKSYGKIEAVRGVDFDVAEGESFDGRRIVDRRPTLQMGLHKK